MSPNGTDDFWEDLLEFIEQGKVIPVIGEHAVTFGEGNEPLYPWLAAELANRLGVKGPRLTAGSTLNDVAREYLLAGGERNAIYTRLSRILRERCPVPGGTLRDLVGVAAFNLTSPRPLTRFWSARSTPCVSAGRRARERKRFSPAQSAKTFPHAAPSLRASQYITCSAKCRWPLGNSSRGRKTLDFLCELPRHLSTDVMKHLGSDLKSHALLLLGLNFSDWLTRLFLRVSRQDPLSRVTLASWLADGLTDSAAQSMVMFFGGVSRSIKVIECDPAAFASELARRWKERHRRCEGP
jgi:hypothetical protein